MVYEREGVRRRTALKTIGGGVIAGFSIAGLTGSAAARTGTLYNLQFNKDEDVAGYTADEPGWNPDRTEPDEWTRVTGRPHNNVVKLNLDEDEDTSGFWAFQGMNYESAGGGSWEVQIPGQLKTDGSMFISPDWEANNEQRRTGLWYALGNDDGDWTWFDILEYRSSAVTGDEASFFRFDSAEGYTDVGVPPSFDAERGGWVDLQMNAEPGEDETGIEWRVDGTTMVDTTFENPFGDTDHFMDFWVQTVNYGQDHDFYYDHFKATITGGKGNGKGKGK